MFKKVSDIYHILLGILAGGFIVFVLLGINFFPEVTVGKKIDFPTLQYKPLSALVRVSPEEYYIIFDYAISRENKNNWYLNSYSVYRNGVFSTPGPATLTLGISESYEIIKFDTWRQ